MRACGVHLRSAFPKECFRGFHKGAGGVDDVVDNQSAAAANISDEVHDFAYVNIDTALVYDGQRRIKALGVTSAKPSPVIPGVPTLASQGLKDYDVDTIGYILAPAKTPPSIIKRLNQHIVHIMSQGDVKERLAAGGDD